jgi:hypothetical protein
MVPGLRRDERTAAALEPTPEQTLQLQKLFVIPAKAGIQGSKASAVTPGPPLCAGATRNTMFYVRHFEPGT